VIGDLGRRLDRLEKATPVESLNVIIRRFSDAPSIQAVPHARRGGAGGRISEHEVVAAKRKRPADLSAYELYLLGGETMKTGLTDESHRDRSHARPRPHTILAWTYGWRANLEADESSVIKKMVEEARRAIDLDPMDADAHETLGYAVGMQGDLNRAEIEFEDAGPQSKRLRHSDRLLVLGRRVRQGRGGATAVDWAMRLNPNYPAWAVDCYRYGLVMVRRYEDVVRNQARQPEEKWNSDGYVVTAGSLAMLGRLDEAKALVARGIAKYPALLSIEKFALNQGWAAPSSAPMADLMRKAGLPACASDKDLADTSKPVRLPECVKPAR
jgi:tetratricopeptide (TPR) repeat protein